MSSEPKHLPRVSGVPQPSSLYATYGAEINALSVEQIFALYERTGFLSIY